MRLLLQRERFDAFYEEALPLLRRHKDEIAQYEDIELDVDVDVYRAAEQAGLIRIYTARIDSGPANRKTLIGYAVFRVGPNPHYRRSLQAVEDVLFVDPGQRKGRVGLDLVRFAERELKAEGVQVLYHHVKVAHPTLGVLLAREGYEVIEAIYGKRIG